MLSLVNICGSVEIYAVQNIMCFLLHFKGVFGEKFMALCTATYIHFDNLFLISYDLEFEIFFNGF